MAISTASCSDLPGLLEKKSLLSWNSVCYEKDNGKESLAIVEISEEEAYVVMPVVAAAVVDFRLIVAVIAVVVVVAAVVVAAVVVAVVVAAVVVVLCLWCYRCTSGIIQDHSIFQIWILNPKS